MISSQGESGHTECNEWCETPAEKLAKYWLTTKNVRGNELRISFCHSLWYLPVTGISFINPAAILMIKEFYKP